MATAGNVEDEPLLTRAEVAALFHVCGQTVTRWAKEGRLAAARTPGNHRRFYERQVKALLRGETWEPPMWLADETPKIRAA